MTAFYGVHAQENVSQYGRYCIYCPVIIPNDFTHLYVSILFCL